MITRRSPKIRMSPFSPWTSLSVRPTSRADKSSGPAHRKGRAKQPAAIEGDGNERGHPTRQEATQESGQVPPVTGATDGERPRIQPIRRHDHHQQRDTHDDNDHQAGSHHAPLPFTDRARASSRSYRPQPRDLLASGAD